MSATYVEDELHLRIEPRTENKKLYLSYKLSGALALFYTWYNKCVPATCLDQEIPPISHCI